MGLVLSFGLMTLLGFASYLLGVAVMLVVFTLWLDLMTTVDARASTLRREIVVACFAPFVFVAHGHAFLLFLVLAGVSSIATGARLRRVLRLRALLPAIALAAYVAWIERGGTIPAGSVAPTQTALEPHFQGAYDKFTLLITPTLMTRTGIDFALGVVVWIVVISATIATARVLARRGVPLESDARDEGEASRAHSRALLACAAVVVIMFLALPHAVGWFGFVDGRLVPIVLFLLLMAVRPSALGRWHRAALEKGAPLFAATLTTLALVASYRFQAEAYGYEAVIAEVPREAKLLNLPLDPNSDVFTAHPFIHYDKLALVDRPIVVSDVWFHQGSALYPTAENPSLRLPSSYSESDLREIDWPTYDLSDWDYVLVRTRPNAAAPKVPTSLALTTHKGGWWLFKANTER
jgi:hypothetical protein